jgi:hypothetical protein
LNAPEYFELARQQAGTEINGFQYLDAVRGLHDIGLLSYDEEAGVISLPGEQLIS